MDIDVRVCEGVCTRCGRGEERNGRLFLSAEELDTTRHQPQGGAVPPYSSTWADEMYSRLCVLSICLSWLSGKVELSSSTTTAERAEGVHLLPAIALTECRMVA